jgi:hypothetical protein
MLTEWWRHFLLQVCGTDNGGRAIMWIGASKQTQINEEHDAVHAGIMCV